MLVISQTNSYVRHAREFFIRRTRETFKENKALTDSSAIQKQFDAARENLNIIKRQVRTENNHPGEILILTGTVSPLQAIIGEMYKTDKLVIEK